MNTDQLITRLNGSSEGRIIASKLQFILDYGEGIYTLAEQEDRARKLIDRENGQEALIRLVEVA